MAAFLPTGTVDRLTQLAKLKSGWDDGRGYPIETNVLRYTRTYLLACVAAEIPMPVIGPLIEDNDATCITLDWLSQHRQICTTVLPNDALSCTLRVSALVPGTLTATGKEFSLPDDTGSAVKYLAELMRA